MFLFKASAGALVTPNKKSYFQQIGVLAIEPNWGWNFSPDCSGYAIFVAEALAAWQIAFERKAGSPFLNTQHVSLQEKIKFLINARIK